ncbi:hypothetical protein PR048_012666 [Dryococelus australis]|uniref:Uncharacterized protein n=1 Tax=Dryococelus australis TaxID=614101 RepID=A0ABQ9HQ08_9NEOP|nr:hypothetical protein PR048_012666 [Dryococelus australis]
MTCYQTILRMFMHDIWASALKNLKRGHFKSHVKYNEGFIDHSFHVGDLVMCKKHTVSRAVDTKFLTVGWAHIKPTFLTPVTAALADPTSGAYITRDHCCQLLNGSCAISYTSMLMVLSARYSATYQYACGCKWVKGAWLEAQPKSAWVPENGMEEMPLAQRKSIQIELVPALHAEHTLSGNPTHQCQEAESMSTIGDHLQWQCITSKLCGSSPLMNNHIALASGRS